MIPAQTRFAHTTAVVLLITSIGYSNAFTASGQVSLQSRNAGTRIAYQTALPLPKPWSATHKSGPETALFISWPGNNDKASEQEGKRDTAQSQLKLSGETAEVSLSSFFSDVTRTESIEDFVAPISDVLDDTTGGWALSYANLEPETESTPIGISFLATNIAYGLAGSLLVAQGNTFLGALTELACIASFGYHYSQLKFGQEGSRIVRLALLVDYFFALSAIAVGSVQLIFAHSIPPEIFVSGAAAIVSLGLCWVWEEGITYIFLHSLWHLFSAYTGYMIGSTQ
ncbi:expressed unknown protein [Seminavis robusta]|uniref:Uncharacterized protein n=1 Tax=Seminavis robusta TaxID=568900 RepID=A0A9N8HLR4_9STRA|nr:expressed unknown protein [Seminavis robusta]|eukprot:Sro1053_g235860.1 n/a (284) ;mRNA; f:17897-18748